MGRHPSDNFTKILLGSRNIYNQVAMTTKNPFFKAGDYYIFKIVENRLEITRPNLDYNGPQLKACPMAKSKDLIVLHPVIDCDYKQGDLEPDEEWSDEDKLVFNLN